MPSPGRRWRHLPSPPSAPGPAAVHGRARPGVTSPGPAPVRPAPGARSPPSATGSGEAEEGGRTSRGRRRGPGGLSGPVPSCFLGAGTRCKIAFSSPEGSFSAGSTEDGNLEKGREGEESERSTEHRGGEKQKAAAAAAGNREDHRGRRQERGEERGEEDAESKGEERRGARQKQKK